MISADGSSIAFQTIADDIVAGDTNNREDVFEVTRATGVARIVSSAAMGAASDGDSFGPSLSQDGRYVAFDSNATNLVTGFVTGAHQQVYVNDAVSHTTAPVSLGTSLPNYGGNDDSQNASISPDGSYVAYDSLATDLGPTDSNTHDDVYLDKLATSTVTRVSKPASGTETLADSSHPLVSADGHYVVFLSFAPNIVLGDTNAHYDVFRYDTSSGIIERLSTSSAGTQGDGDSATYAATSDGQHVVFWSASTNLVPGDTNGFIDIFVRDLG